MANSKSYFARPSYCFLSGDRDYHRSNTSDSAYELNESEIFNSARSISPEFLKSASNLRLSKKPTSKRADSGDRMIGSPASLPVNIPDWSKILRHEYRENRRDSFEDDEDDVDEDGEGEGEGEGGARVPPHEFLARTRMASFSVHEGVGRTLKGRDLRRVRNAIFEKTGFQD